MSERGSTSNRRTFLKYAAATTAVSGLAGCTTAGGGGGGDQLKIGGLHPVSGPIASLGEPQREAMQLAVDQANEDGGILGEEVETVFEDSTTEPIVKARNLIEEENVDVIEGVILSSTVVKVQQLIRDSESDVIFLNNGSGSDAILSTPNCTRNYFHTDIDNSQRTQAVRGVAREHGSDWYFVAADYLYGHDSLAKMKGAIADEMDLDSPDDASVGEELVPLDQTDFRTVIREAQQADSDVIGLVLVGAGYTTMINQLGELDVDIPVHHLYPQDVSLRAAPDAIEDITLTSGSHWTWTDKSNERAWEYAQAYRAEYDEYPDTAIPGYYGTKMFFEAVEAAGTTDSEAVVDAFEGRQFSDTIMGVDYVQMRACDHQVQLPIHVIEARNHDEFGPSWHSTQLLDNSDGQLMQPCGAAHTAFDENRCDYS